MNQSDFTRSQSIAYGVLLRGIQRGVVPTKIFFQGARRYRCRCLTKKNSGKRAVLCRLHQPHHGLVQTSPCHIVGELDTAPEALLSA